MAQVRPNPDQEPTAFYSQQNADLLLFESPSPWKIRALTVCFAAVLVFCAACSRDVLHHMTRNAISPELAPLSWRVAAAIIISGAGVAFFGGMLIFMRFYCTRLFQVAGQDQVRVETLRLFCRRERTLAASRIVSASYYRGKFSSDLRPTVQVDAPWFWVSVSGGRGFLLDVQGNFLESAALAKLLTANYTRPIGGDGDQQGC